MKQNYIEEINKYNQKISIFNLIYKKIKFKWWLIIGLFLIPFFISIVFLQSENYWWLFLSIPLTGGLAILSAKLLTREIEKVIANNYSYVLNETSNNNNKMFLEIQKEELCRLLGDDLIRKDNLIFLMDKIPNHAERYSFGFTIAVVSLIATIITGTFLGKFLDFATDMKDFINGSKSLILVLFFYGMLFIIIDVSLIKMLVLQYKKIKTDF